MIRFAQLLLVAAAGLGAETFTGIITDSTCVANHTMAACSDG